MGPTLDDIRLSLTHHKPGPDAIKSVERLRTAAKEFAVTVMRECPQSRERSIAVTELETAVMWAVKSVVIPRQEKLA